MFILTDDQRADMLWAMPHVEHAILHQGKQFDDAFVSNPLCCPSRSAILTGRFSHSTDVWRNEPPDGGFQTFTERGEDQSTIATWLHAAGYHTGLVGKYLNGYDTDMTYVPPGWDRWYAISSELYYDYDISDQGSVTHFGFAPIDYSTSVLGDAAVQFIKDTSGPLFLYFAPIAPHTPAIPANRDAKAFADLAPWRPPSYAEHDVSDKPFYIRRLAWSAHDRTRTDEFRRRQFRCLLSVDRAVGEILDALRATGRLSNTAILFMSDNGLEWGEHRWIGKTVPYDESIHVPLLFRDDALGLVHRHDTHLVLGVDIAPTIAQLAGVDAPGAEGTSFLPLLAGDGAPWRSGFPLEHLRIDPPTLNNAPTFCGLRTVRYMYARYESGFEELYDLAADPYQRTNIASTHPGVVAGLRERTEESCNPPPPGYAW